MPVKFLRDAKLGLGKSPLPLGVIIYGGQDGLKLAVTARPCDLKQKRPKVGATTVETMKMLVDGPKSLRELLGDQYTRVAENMIGNRCLELRALSLAEKTGIKWSLTEAGHQWLKVEDEIQARLPASVPANEGKRSHQRIATGPGRVRPARRPDSKPRKAPGAVFTPCAEVVE